MKDAELSIDRSEVIVVIGCKGAGKSTRMKIITGSIEPTTGEVQRYYGSDSLTKFIFLEFAFKITFELIYYQSKNILNCLANFVG
jgi:ABC-type polysaccharide/polyol phosphate transport system ATPase subunit